MSRQVKTKKRFIRRKASTRKHISGTASKPRVSIRRTAKHIYAQLIDDETHNTIVSSSDLNLKLKTGKPVEKAMQVGEALGKKAIAKKVDKLIFDRSGYKYHGRVKALADGLRKAGLNF